MILREMLVDDLDQVMEIEQDLFHVPWTKEGFFTFLTRDDAMFLVVEEKEKILGYCGQDDRNNIGDIQLHLQLSENEKADQIYHSGTSAKENIADNGTFIHFSDPLLHKIYPLSPVYFHS